MISLTSRYYIINYTFKPKYNEKVGFYYYLFELKMIACTQVKNVTGTRTIPTQSLNTLKWMIQFYIKIIK